MLLAARCARQSNFSISHTARRKPFVSHPRLHVRACLCWQNRASAFPGAAASMFVLMLRGMSSPSCRACMCLCEEGGAGGVCSAAREAFRAFFFFFLVLQPPCVPEQGTRSAGIWERAGVGRSGADIGVGAGFYRQSRQGPQQPSGWTVRRF